MTSLADLQTVPYSSDERVNALLDQSAAWNFATNTAGNTIYYTYDYYLNLSQSVDSQVYRFNPSQIEATEKVLDYVSSITGVQFEQTTDIGAALFFLQGDIFEPNTTGLTEISYSYEYFSEDEVVAYEPLATVYLDTVEFADQNTNPYPGSRGYETLLHEIGHVMGLKHPFEGLFQLEDELDTTANTVMSYTSGGAPTESYQQYDLEALDWLYGRDGLGGLYGVNSLYGPLLSSSATQARVRDMTVIVDKGVLAEQPVILSSVEDVVLVTYGVVSERLINALGQSFRYEDISSLYQPVLVNGEFSAEFQNEIADAFPDYANISYEDVINLIGVDNINELLIAVAGQDSNFVG